MLKGAVDGGAMLWFVRWVFLQGGIHLTRALLHKTLFWKALFERCLFVEGLLGRKGPCVGRRGSTYKGFRKNN
eukprot:2272364-Amphidinium_carterae.1